MEQTVEESHVINRVLKLKHEELIREQHERIARQRRKDRIARESEEALRRIILGEPYIDFDDPDLVPLFSGEHKDKLSEKLLKRTLSDLSSPLPKQLPVLGSKQFVIGDVWVMCVKLVNNRGRRIYNVALSATLASQLTSEKPSASNNSIVAVGSYKVTDQSEVTMLNSKRPRMEYDRSPIINRTFFAIESDETFYLVTALKLPSFTLTNPAVVQPAVMWRERRGDVSVDVTSEADQRQLTEGFWCVEKCDIVYELSAADVVSEKLNLQLSHVLDRGNGEVADRLWARLAMDTLQQSVRVCVSAQHSNLATFWQCVGQAGFTEVSSWGCHVYKGGGPLQWARITDDSDGTSGGDRRPIHVLLTTSNDRQLALLLHTLYAVLPSDCVIHVTGGRADVTETFTELVESSVHKELQLFNAHFKQNTSRFEMPSAFSCEGREGRKGHLLAEEVNEVRQLFALKQSCVAVGACLAGSHGPMQCADFTQDFCEQMEHTDWAVSILERLQLRL